MGVATVLIGLLPTYAQIGIWAPIALIVLRLVQGFAVGGEWGGAVLMAAEHGDAARRGFWASWPQAGVAAGSLLSAGVLALLARLPGRGGFPRLGLAGSVPALGAARRRRLVHPQPGVGEPRPSRMRSRRRSAPPKLPALDVFRERPKAVVLGAGLRVGENISYYILTVFSLTFLVDVAAESRSLALNALADRRGGAVLRDSPVRPALRPDRAAPGLCVRRLRAGGVELRLVSAAGERRAKWRSCSRSSSASSSTARCTARRRR